TTCSSATFAALALPARVSTTTLRTQNTWPTQRSRRAFLVSTILLAVAGAAWAMAGAAYAEARLSAAAVTMASETCRYVMVNLLLGCEAGCDYRTRQEILST